MRKGILASSVLLSAAIAVSGCNTGDVGQKNIRPYYANDYVKNGLPINGTHSFGAPTYRTRFANDQANEQNRWMGRNGLNNFVVGAHDNYHLRTNDRIENELSAMPGVGAARVMLTDHNAYVGITPNRSGQMNAAAADVEGKLKDKIADRVKAMSPLIQNVYVTSNPEFVDRLTHYSEAAAAGHPVQDYLAEFNALVSRIFPAHSTSGTNGRSATSGTFGTSGTR
ncbi:YhcN/YlaJ family sporulation lipoprotein [Cohnella candidum]|uniref:YhcN/YlaJ family sporulation lipoprotein n=1 Tax=Cohnella candidum TaxID=2674991 RepID=A0A3G3JVB5_9BACL|nr:YhcN/YlaJ family sporulation lipoprotein [Cohnella candidum]AYQ71449.1 hypothetical protein EAV92_01920 [Cohnella candidum]